VIFDRLYRNTQPIRDLLLFQLLEPAHPEDSAALFGQLIDSLVKTQLQLVGFHLLRFDSLLGLQAVLLLLDVPFVLVQEIEAAIDHAPVQIGLQRRLDGDLFPVLPKMDKYIIHNLLRLACISQVLESRREEEFIMVLIILFENPSVLFLYRSPDIIFFPRHALMDLNNL
jgi:hypothetical protein